MLRAGGDPRAERRGRGAARRAGEGARRPDAAADRRRAARGPAPGAVSVRAGAPPGALGRCELLPLFDMSQPALAKHVRVLVNAGVVGSEKRGLWTYYY